MHRLISVCLLCFCFAGCSTTKSIEEQSGYRQISRTELQETLESSVRHSHQEQGAYAPRWFYAGSDDDYHYIFYYYPTYLHYNLPPPPDAHFYKIRRTDLSVGVESLFNPELSRAREVFRKPSSFSELSIEEQHKQRIEKGDGPDTASYEYSIDYVGT